MFQTAKIQMEFFSWDINIFSVMLVAAEMPRKLYTWTL